jgi:hypothetical protein
VVIESAFWGWLFFFGFSFNSSKVSSFQYLQKSSDSSPKVHQFLRMFSDSQGRNLLVTLGKEDAGTKLKVWSTEDTGRAPSVLRTIDCFGGKHAEAGVTELAVHNSHPQLVYALGLSTGYVLVLRADTGVPSLLTPPLLTPPPPAQPQ